MTTPISVAFSVSFVGYRLSGEVANNSGEPEVSNMVLSLGAWSETISTDVFPAMEGLLIEEFRKVGYDNLFAR